MSVKIQTPTSNAVQYINQYKDRYSRDQLRQKLIQSGYTIAAVSEAEAQVFDGISQRTAETTDMSTGRKIGEYVYGLAVYILLILFGFGVIGLGIAIFLYIHFKEKRVYFALGIRGAFIASVGIMLIFIIALFYFT